MDLVAAAVTAADEFMANGWSWRRRAKSRAELQTKVPRAARELEERGREPRAFAEKNNFELRARGKALAPSPPLLWRLWPRFTQGQLRTFSFRLRDLRLVCMRK
eukprot:scaffold1483_cov153-Skeletonema_menzelii.AAC.32